MDIVGPTPTEENRITDDRTKWVVWLTWGMDTAGVVELREISSSERRAALAREVCKHDSKVVRSYTERRLLNHHYGATLRGLCDEEIKGMLGA